MKKDHKNLRATLAALFAQVIFGFSFLFTKLALGVATPFIVLADRYLVAVIAMSLIIVISKTKLRFSRQFWKLMVMACFQPVLYFLFETYGIRMTTSSFSSVMIAMIPVVSMISGIFLLQEIPSFLQYVFTALSVVGVSWMAFLGTSDGTVTPLGILLLSGAVVSSVCYNVMSRRLSSEFSPLERTYVMMLTGFVVFMGVALVENFKNPLVVFLPFTHTTFTGSVFYLGAVSSVLAFFLMNYANTYLPVSKTTVFSNFTTVVSVVAGVLFLQEPFSLQAFVAIALIIIGVGGAQLQTVKTKK
ncbi:MAG: DMT family transporter [Clostridia bacterium]|nr:DMT family transporter [Clostridia bacterium]